MSYESACEYCEVVYGGCKIELGYPEEECEERIAEKYDKMESEVAQQRYEDDMEQKDSRVEQLIKGEDKKRTCESMRWNR